MEEFTKNNYKNPDKVIRLYYSELAKLKGGFSRKYPSADMSKFDFQVSIKRNGDLDSSKIWFNVDSISSFNIESHDFKNNPKYTKYLHKYLRKNLNKDSNNDSKYNWPKIWNASTYVGTSGYKKPEFTRLRFPKDPLTKCDEHKCGIPADSKFQEPVDLKQSLHTFRLYVNERSYFMSNLPHIYVKWSSGKVFNEHGLHDIRKAGFDRTILCDDLRSIHSKLSIRNFVIKS